MLLSDRVTYREYDITLVEPILGSQPSSQAVYREMIAARAPEPDEEGREEEAMLPPEETRTTVFLRDAAGHACLMDYQVMGFLKEAGNTLKELFEAATPGGKPKKKPGITALRSKLQNFVSVYPRIISLGKAPDGYYERPLQAMTMKGPRVCMARSEIIDPGVTIRIKIGLLPHPEVTWDLLEQLLEYGQFKGLGQFRNGGYGRFSFRRIAEAA
jgi:hypothetical protein